PAPPPSPFPLSLHDALPISRSVWERQRDRLGKDHPKTLTSLSNLAMLERLAGRLDAAEPLSREAYALRRARLGDDDPETLLSGSNLAVVLVARCSRGDVGRGDVLAPPGVEAERLLKELLPTARRSARATPATEPQILSSLGNRLLLQGRAEAADAVYSAAAEVAVRAWGEERTETWTTRVGAGAAALCSGRRAEAERKIRAASAWLSDRLGEEDEAARNAAVWLRQ